MNKLIFILIIFTGTNALSQAIKGMVADENHQGLIGAAVRELGSTNGVTTDVNGRFELKLSKRNAKIVVSFVGYQTDTLAAGFSGMMHIMLKPTISSLNEVTVTGQSTFLDNLESKHVEVITESELAKAACCNLSESFETNASVDVSFTDAITGAKTIRMLGLDGRYVLINRENIPHVRGLSGRYGLGYVPGTWIQSIDLGKGAGTVVNGYESMTGQINVELKKPEQSEKLYLNAYGNSFGRMELNANAAFRLNDKWSSGVLLHGDYFNSELDGNDDGFMDLPKSKQVNLMNRYKYRDDKMVGQIGFQFMNDQKAGGQLGFDFEDDFSTSPEYGFSNRTTRVEVFGKTGLLFPHKPYKGWGFIYSASHLDIDGGYGRDNYTGNETTVYGNVIFQNIIGNSFHQYKTGASILSDSFDEVYADSVFSRSEVVPGMYFEYAYLPGDQFTLVAGARTDFHNLYGDYFTPRLHVRYQMSESTTFRGAVGKGYRTPNVIMENSRVLVSNRQLIVQEAPRPEISWNAGGSIVTAISLGEKKLNLIGDYFYTDFQNQLIYDMDQSSNELNIYNLKGRSYAHSFQVEANMQFNEFFGLKSAYKYYDVRSTINRQLRQVPFNARDRFFLNASYATKYDKWEIDYTLHWYGEKRLPDTSDKPLEFQLANRTPSYFHMNAQISRGFRWGSIYVGSENLNNFTQRDPIVDPENPFGDDFDASLTWAPVAGRLVYFGFRYKIK